MPTISLDSPNSSSPTLTSTPSMSVKEQRCAVKKIVRDADSDLRKLKRVNPNSYLHHEVLNVLFELQQKSEKLDELQATNLETAAPKKSAGRKAKANSALVLGTLGRGAAATAVSGIAVVEGVAAGTCNMVAHAVNCGIVGAEFFGSIPIPGVNIVAGIGGAAFGLATGSVVGALAIPVAAYVYVFKTDSKTRYGFNLLDRLPKARAYAIRKQSSTADIAQSSQARISRALVMCDENPAGASERPPRLVYTIQTDDAFDSFGPFDVDD
jgi:hypothetical protein